MHASVSCDFAQVYFVDFAVTLDVAWRALSNNVGESDRYCEATASGAKGRARNHRKAIPMPVSLRFFTA